MSTPRTPSTDPMQAAPAPFSYNPSAWSQRIPICILAAVATAIAAYMALYQWRLIDSVWDPMFGDSTQKVLDSKVAQTMDHWIGIPDAALGAFAYLGDAILGLAGSTRRWQYRPWMVILFGVDVIPLGVVSAVLVILQGTVVGYWCFLCLVTAIISLILAYWAYDEVWASVVYLWKVWKETHSGREVWLAFAGYRTEAGERVGNQMTGQMLSEVT
ncbi:vitamin K epoxide reductase family protein [Aeoliella sp. SH292]|uniref:vitamin K epoxide reductase family protein n=1 Tax=Aeoliella sp. SH292 TaxID=3454464 RepID=UPI003F9DE394